MVELLKKQVYDANMLLPKYGLVTFTWGNVSGIDREAGLFVIKPSGVDYEKLTPEDMVVMNLLGEVVEGSLKPSSDAPTHLVMYNEFKEIGGVVHTHSLYATGFAQAGIGISAYGTTHADYFYGEVPCSRAMTDNEILNNYEEETGKLIVETIGNKNSMEIPACLIKNHGPFVWGTDAGNAVHNAVVLEEIAKMTDIAKRLNPDMKEITKTLLDKHYLRKHGANAYYGQ